jgi:hypothetical protein
MGRAVLCCFVLLLLSACYHTTGNAVVDLNSSVEKLDNSTLFVEQATVQKERTVFTEKLKTADTNKRTLYEEYIGIIGANGILESIETIWPLCHNEAHDLGKVIFANLKDIGQSLRICGSRCRTGCMHGVLMEAFTQAKIDDEEGHIDAAKLKTKLKEICFNNSEMISTYGLGECAHGVGHALMFLNGYNIKKTLNACTEFDNTTLEYYCATGGYMEYNLVFAHNTGQTTFYPCDTFDYPAACMLSRAGSVATKMYQEGKNMSDVIAACKQLDGKYRLGCFHGIGNAYSGFFTSGNINLTELCSSKLSEDEQTVCIEGAMEHIGKYQPDAVSKICEELGGNKRGLCLTAGKHKLYSLEKNLSNYQK